MTDEQWIDAALTSTEHYLMLAEESEDQCFACKAEGVLDFIHFQATRTNVQLNDAQQERYTKARERL